MEKKRTSITAAVIAKDAERHLRECLQSVSWADELLVVVDEASSDGTLALAQELAHQMKVNKFVNYSQQRNVALQLASSDWVLFVDADERVPEELRSEICEVLHRDEQPYSGYWIPRRNMIFGVWVRHSGWYPDYQLRLLRRGRAYYDERRAVHELAQLDGPTAHLGNTLIHYNYDSMRQFTDKQSRYAAAEARTMFENGIRPKWQNYILQPLREFNRRYITWCGYRDGPLGFQLATLMAYYNLVMYLHLRKLWQTHQNNLSADQPQQDSI